MAAELSTRDTSAAASAGTWGRRTPLPIAISEVGVAAVHGGVHVIGGTDQHGSEPPSGGSATHLRYDPVADNWEARAPLPDALHHVGVTELEGQLYAIGGLRGNVHIGPQPSAFVYNPGSDRWTALPPLPTARGSLGVVGLGRRVHAFGGRTAARIDTFSPPGGPNLQVGSGTSEAHDVYDPDAGEWSPGPPLPGPPRDHMGVAVLDGRIHVFGGRINDFTDMLDRHDVFDPVTGTWSVAAPLPRPRSAGAFTVLEGLIIYAGGECRPGGEPFTANAFEDVTAYDSATGRWVELTPLTRGRHAFGAATIGKVAYFAGGALVCGGGASTDLLTLTLS